MSSPSPAEPWHAFVDETKRRGFSLVRCDVPARDLNDVRLELRRLLRGNQRRIHFYKESKAVRDAVLRIAELTVVQVSVYTAFQPERRARQACLATLVADAQDSNIAMLIFEDDESFRHRDRQTIHEMISKNRQPMNWHHVPAYAEPALWLPDAIAWCVNNPDPRWRRAIDGLEMRRVEI